MDLKYDLLQGTPDKNLVVPILTLPLLGSPYTCSVWGPNDSTKLPTPEEMDSFSSNSTFTPSSLLIGKSYPPLELETTSDELRSFFSCMTDLHRRLDHLFEGVRQMRLELHSIASGLQKLTIVVDRRIQNAKYNRMDLEDKIYLEQLICILNGDLRHFPSRNCPFNLFSRDNNDDINLII